MLVGNEQKRLRLKLLKEFRSSLDERREQMHNSIYLRTNYTSDFYQKTSKTITELEQKIQQIDVWIHELS